VRTLYIDRDPVTFRDVARHLQGLTCYQIEVSTLTGVKVTMSSRSMEATS
jgi:hypothetical protein